MPRIVIVLILALAYSSVAEAKRPRRSRKRGAVSGKTTKPRKPRPPKASPPQKPESIETTAEKPATDEQDLGEEIEEEVDFEEEEEVAFGEEEGEGPGLGATTSPRNGIPEHEYQWWLVALPLLLLLALMWNIRWRHPSETAQVTSGKTRRTIKGRRSTGSRDTQRERRQTLTDLQS